MAVSCVFHVYSAAHVSFPFAQHPPVGECPISGLVPVHGAPQGSLPALENGDIFLTRAGNAPLGSTFRQEHLISVLQLFQLFTACPEA